MRTIIPLLVLLALLLSACSAALTGQSAAATSVVTLIPAPTATGASSTAATPAPATPAPTIADSGDDQPAGQDLARVDEQGAVVVEVTPVNLSNAGDTLNFTVAMNTHSVNLSMDLAQLATLTTDTGLAVEPSAWDGMSGGHHVSGTLSFPAKVDEKNLLEGARVVTLVIKNVDTPERTFTWAIQPQ